MGCEVSGLIIASCVYYEHQWSQKPHCGVVIRSLPPCFCLWGRVAGRGHRKHYRQQIALQTVTLCSLIWGFLTGPTPLSTSSSFLEGETAGADQPSIEKGRCGAGRRGTLLPTGLSLGTSLPNSSQNRGPCISAVHRLPRLASGVTCRGLCRAITWVSTPLPDPEPF